MFRIAAHETYEDGHVIFEDGDQGDWIYVVEKGEVEISKSMDGQHLVIEVLKSGDIFGEMAYLDKEPRSATAIAKGKTVVGVVDQIFADREFNKLSPELRKIFKTLVLRIRRMTDYAIKSEKERKSNRTLILESISRS